MVPRVRRLATSLILLDHVSPCASGDVSVPRIDQSGIATAASPPANAQVRIEQEFVIGIFSQGEGACGMMFRDYREDI